MTDPEVFPPREPLRGQTFLEKHNVHPIVFAVACLFVVFVLYQLVAGTVTYWLVGGTSITRENAFSVRLYTMIGQLACILLPTVLLARLLSTRLSDVFRWRVPGFGETLYALLGLLFLQQVFQIYLFFQDRIPLPEILKKVLDPFKEMIETMFRNLVSAESIPELLFVIVVVAVVPAVTEELFFRGLIQRSFEKAVAPVQAAILSGLIFGFYHFNPFAIVPLVGLGCYFGLLRLRSDSIIIAMTAHFVNNALAGIAVYFSMEHEMIIGAAKSEDPNIGAVLVQFVLYLTLFLLAFAAYIRASRKVKESE
ncbi:MAG: CPBP family intramembrane metalloprotease [Ignavibacteriales bacterium]|nr:CPBP family intramembrane metalloprotease [Ignavibacteriales bacterium]